MTAMQQRERKGQRLQNEKKKKNDEESKTTTDQRRGSDKQIKISHPA